MTPRRLLAPLLALLLTGLFVALGLWQLERREWKHALIARVEARIHAAPSAAPGPAAWPAITAADAYRRVTADGRFLQGQDTLVRATTTLGSGYWVLTPLRTPGFTVLVNRGFIPPEGKSQLVPVEEDPVRVTGLLRVTEPGGAFLRANQPAEERWYSRDIVAIAATRRLGPVAPYFIDSEAAPNKPGDPTGGLTLIRFADNHLMYALTWFGLALLSLAGGWIVLRQRHPGAEEPA